MDIMVDLQWPATGCRPGAVAAWRNAASKEITLWRAARDPDHVAALSALSPAAIRPFSRTIGPRLTPEGPRPADRSRPPLMAQLPGAFPSLTSVQASDAAVPGRRSSVAEQHHEVHPVLGKLYHQVLGSRPADRLLADPDPARIEVGEPNPGDASSAPGGDGPFGCHGDRDRGRAALRRGDEPAQEASGIKWPAAAPGAASIRARKPADTLRLRGTASRPSPSRPDSRSAGTGRRQ